MTVELKSGESYRGLLSEAEDTMNCQLRDVTVTARDGRVTRLEQVFLRGGMIKFVILPEILKNAVTVTHKCCANQMLVLRGAAPFNLMASSRDLLTVCLVQRREKLFPL